MQNVLAIARREIRASFNTPLAYIVLGVFLLIAGWMMFFFSGFFENRVATLRAFFGLSPILLMFLAPAISMRLIAEERKSGTVELLLTLPMRDGEIILGKFLAALLMVCVGFFCTLLYPITVSSITTAGDAFDWGPVIGGYIGLVFLAGSFLAVGLWASALSKNQIIGFIIGIALCFALWIVDKAIIIMPSSIAPFFEYLSVDYHFNNIARGVIDTRDVVYYLSVIATGLLLSSRALSSARQ